MARFGSGNSVRHCLINKRIEQFEYARELVGLVDHQHRRHVALGIDNELRAKGAAPAEGALGSGKRALAVRYSDGKAEPEPVAGPEQIGPAFRVM
jgi:hypothetical protein